MNIAVDDTSTAELPPAKADLRIHRFWPQTVIAFGLGLCAAWTYMLGYGLIRLIELAI